MDDIYEIGTALYVPQHRSDFPKMVAAIVAEFKDRIMAAFDAFLAERTPESFRRLEESLFRLFAIIASHLIAGVLGWMHHDECWVQSSIERARAKAATALRHRGRHETTVLFLGGARVKFETPYLSMDLTGRPGRKRGVGRRGRAGGGCYPVLEALGIHDRASPALASEVAKQSVRTASFEEAREALDERGLPVDTETVRRIAERVGKQALVQRDARIQAAKEGRKFSDEFAGEIIVISIDGGRIRMREGGKRGRKNKNGRRRFRTPWREPKLITAHIVDAKGRKKKGAVPLYDGTLGDADAAIANLIAELQLRGADKAKLIVLVADGALWIWDRADEIAAALGLPPERFVKVADFYHAVEHLAAIGDLKASWSPEERRNWVRRQRRRLKKGQIDAVIQAARQLCVGRNSGEIATEVRYFETRRELMRYDVFRARGLPIGSGAVESGIRRVVNLRLKGPGIFWRRENAERMLHLRAYLKAGRWNEVMSRVMNQSPNGAGDQRAEPSRREAA